MWAIRNEGSITCDEVDIDRALDYLDMLENDPERALAFSTVIYCPYNVEHCEDGDAFCGQCQKDLVDELEQAQTDGNPGYSVTSRP